MARKAKPLPSARKAPPPAGCGCSTGTKEKPDHGTNLAGANNRRRSLGPAMDVPESGCSSEQLAERPVRFGQVLRPAAEIAHLRRRHVDPQMMVECRQHFLEVDRTLFRLFTQSIRRTDHLTDLHSAAGEKRARHARPVIAACGGIHPRTAAELAP